VNTRKITIAVAGLMAMAAALAVAPTAQAAPVTTVTFGRLVLEPTGHGYHGSLPVEVVYQGSQPGSGSFVITEPVRAAYQNPAMGVNCSSSRRLPDGRRQAECDVPGGPLEPGERRSFALDFEVLTAIRPFAMKAVGGQIQVKTDGTVVAQQAFTTLFRSSTGSLLLPRTYVQDTAPDSAIAAGPARLVRQTDGTFKGRMTVRVRYRGDAAHNGHLLTFELPEGISAVVSDPYDGCPHQCVPGDKFTEGEVRTFDYLLEGAAGTPIGRVGVGSISVETEAFVSGTPDANPSDNTDSFEINTVEAA
jgi:hypothetical protein